MKHIHKLVWVDLLVNIITCFVARNLLFDEGQLNFRHRTDSMWSWLVFTLFIAAVVQVVNIILSGYYPYLVIMLAFIGGIMMVPVSIVFLVGCMFNFRTQISAGFTPWRSTTGVIGRGDNYQLLAFNVPGFYPQGTLALIVDIIISMIGTGIGGVSVAADAVALCNDYHLQNRVVIGTSGESMISTPGFYVDTCVIPLGNVVLAGRRSNDAKVRLWIHPSGRNFTLRKKLLAGDSVSDTFAAILAKLSTA